MPLAIEISEAEFMRQVTDLASHLGWRWLHIERMGNAQGRWRTPVSGPLGIGFPDLMMIRRGKVIFIELKAQRGMLTREQKDRLFELQEIGETYVFRPRDWAFITEVLNA